MVGRYLPFLLSTLVACGGGGEDTSVSDTGATDVPELVQLESIELLTRLSMDLRGFRPSLEEIELVEADVAQVETLMEQFLHSDSFGAQLRSAYSNIFLTRLDYYYVTAEDYGLTDEALFAASVGEEPLRILSHIVENDLPYTEVVRSDWTMANETLAEAWDLDYPEGATGWQQARYTDSRPSGGVLSTNSFWWRYMSNASNANRGRAAAVAKTFLCVDYLSKPIEFDRTVNLLDAAAVSNALQTNEGCVACHATLDPLASFLWGFYYFDYDSREDISNYHPEREKLWEEYTEVSPGYFGEPGYTFEDLTRGIAGDSGFIECAVEQAFEIFMGRPGELADTTRMTAHRAAFLSEGLVMRDLYRSILSDPLYRARAADPVDSLTAPNPAQMKMISTDQMASQLEALTGFRFAYYGYDMMTTDTYGLRTLAGGVDGSYVTAPATNPTSTMLLVQERLAEAAASFAVSQALLGQPPTILQNIGFFETPSTDYDRFVEHIQMLHLAIFGNRIAADGPEVEANIELWNQLLEVDGSITTAWEGLLSVLFRDPDFMVY